MLCPVCKNVQLLMSEKQGIEIDYCPNCRGIWLDRGELDKIIEKNNNSGTNNINSNSFERYNQDVDRNIPRNQHYKDEDYYKNNHKQYPPKKRENWLENIFDF